MSNAQRKTGVMAAGFVLVTGALFLAGVSWAYLAKAATADVALPADYAKNFILYQKVEHPEKTPPTLSVLYVNKEAADKAEKGKPNPYGTVLVFEERDAKSNALNGIFVMEKRKGFGAGYGPDKRNGEWEYAWFLPAGGRKADKELEECFTCHKAQAAEDFNFTFSKWVNEGKPER
jgi:hypothetical protein